MKNVCLCLLLVGLALLVMGARPVGRLQTTTTATWYYAPGSDSAPVTSFELWRQTACQGAWQLVATLPPTQSSFVDVVEGQQTYCWYVDALEDPGTVQLASNIVTCTINRKGRLTCQGNG